MREWGNLPNFKGNKGKKWEGRVFMVSKTKFLYFSFIWYEEQKSEGEEIESR